MAMMECGLSICANNVGLGMKGDGRKRVKEARFLASHLVWGKVRSHPWWPGQIFEPWDASEQAKKHFNPNTYLVAYFEDQTFAWNEETKLKPFWPFFSQMSKQRDRTFPDCSGDGDGAGGVEFGGGNEMMKTEVNGEVRNVNGYGADLFVINLSSSMGKNGFSIE